MGNERNLMTSIEYDLRGDKPVLHLFSRNLEGLRSHFQIVGFRPYFFVKDPNQVRIVLMNKKKSPLVSFSSGFPLWQVFTRIPKVVGSAVKELEESGTRTWEGKVLFPLRFLIDAGIYSGFRKEGEKFIPYAETEIKPKIVFLDIERAKHIGIICITLFDSLTKEYTLIYYPVKDEVKIPGMYSKSIKCSSEKELLQAFLQYIQDSDPDIITGYYLEGYDIPNLIGAMSENGVDYDLLSPLKIVSFRKKGWEGYWEIKGREILDLWRIYRFIIARELESFKLEKVCEREGINIPKIPIKDFTMAWMSTPELVLERNLNDCRSIVALDEKLGAIAFIDEIRRFVGVRYSDALTRSRLADVFLLRKARMKGIALPSQPEATPIAFQGAIVLPPIKGYHQDVVVSDFSAMYPNIIIAFNMSPETLDPNGEISVGNGVRFAASPMGLIPECLKEIKTLRKVHQDTLKRTKLLIDKLKSEGLKYIVNTFWGVLMYKEFRLMTPAIAESIPFVGREFLTICVKKVEELGGKVVAGDTDSCFFKVDEERLRQLGTLEKAASYYIGEINSLGKKVMEAHGLTTVPFEIRIEYFFRDLFYKDKKHYIGKTTTGEKIVKGMNRSDLSEVASELLFSLLDMILERKEKGEIQEWLRKRIQGIYKEPPFRLAVPSKIGKDEYKTNVAQKRAAEYSNTWLGTSFRTGDKPRRLWVSAVPSNFPRTDIIAIDDETHLPPGFIPDYHKCLENEIKGKLLPVLELIGLNWDHLGSKSLEEFTCQDAKPASAT